jgi:hypothetical protein
MPLKKSKAKEVYRPAWHADFRKADALPDTKVIRTSFFVNFSAVTLPLLLAAWVANNEINASELRDEIAELEGRIASARPLNAESLKQDKAFRAEQQRLQAFIEFNESAIDPLLYVAAISDSRPENMVLHRISVGIQSEERGRGRKKKTVHYPRIAFSGTLEGYSTQALAALKDYEAMLLDLPELEGRVSNFTAVPSRTQDENLLDFRITISLGADA